MSKILQVPVHMGVKWEAHRSSRANVIFTAVLPEVTRNRRFEFAANDIPMSVTAVDQVKRPSGAKAQRRSTREVLEASMPIEHAVMLSVTGEPVKGKMRNYESRGK